MGNKRKTYTITSFGNEREVVLSWGKYGYNNTLSLSLISKPDEDDIEEFGLNERQANAFSELYTVVTVNLEQSMFLPENVQFVDSNNNENIEDWLVKNGIATPTDIYAPSGYCMYRAYKFNVPESKRRTKTARA